MPFDLQVLRGVSTLRSPVLTVLFIVITAFGTAPVATLLSITIGSTPRLHLDRSMFIRLAVAPLGGWMLTEILKRWFARPRPSLVEPLVKATGFSFPSGHAVVASAGYLTLAIVICRRLEHTRDRVVVMIAASILVLAIGLSRVYLGVHYPTDVITGITIGILLAFAVSRRIP